MKVANLFNPNEGITGTLEQRKEICKILFEKKLLSFQEDSLEKEIQVLSDETEVDGIYFSDTSKMFNFDFKMFGSNINTEIPFEEFKQRLTQI